MRIAIILDAPYPLGMASTNRIHLYAKGLMELGNNVDILIPRPTEKSTSIRNVSLKGTHEGVKFQYAYKTTVRSEQFFGRRVHDLISIFYTFFVLVFLKPQVILLLSNSTIYVVLSKIYAVFTKAKFVREKTEIPFFQIGKISKLRQLWLKAEYGVVDGLIVISGKLKDFFYKELSIDAKFLEVPILIDSSDSLLDVNIETQKMPLIVYTGSFYDKKDGILTLIRAFSKILSKYPEAGLILTGDIDSSPDKYKIFLLINKLRIKNRIELTGYVSKKRLDDIKSQASVFIVAKPETFQNRYNMATRIGEYLITGHPVILSSVDSAGMYLRHRQSALIVNPDEESIAQEIDFILCHPEEAMRIGSRGKEVALSCFDYKIHAIHLNTFLNDL